MGCHQIKSQCSLEKVDMIFYIDYRKILKLVNQNQNLEKNLNKVNMKPAKGFELTM